MSDALVKSVLEDLAHIWSLLSSLLGPYARSRTLVLSDGTLAVTKFVPAVVSKLQGVSPLASLVLKSAEEFGKAYGGRDSILQFIHFVIGFLRAGPMRTTAMFSDLVRTAHRTVQRIPLTNALIQGVVRSSIQGCYSVGVEDHFVRLVLALGDVDGGFRPSRFRECVPIQITLIPNRPFHASAVSYNSISFVVGDKHLVPESLRANSTVYVLRENVDFLSEQQLVFVDTGVAGSQKVIDAEIERIRSRIQEKSCGLLLVVGPLSHRLKSVCAQLQMSVVSAADDAIFNSLPDGMLLPFLDISLIPSSELIGEQMIITLQPSDYLETTPNVIICSPHAHLCAEYSNALQSVCMTVLRTLESELETELDENVEVLPGCGQADFLMSAMDDSVREFLFPLCAQYCINAGYSPTTVLRLDVHHSFPFIDVFRYNDRETAGSLQLFDSFSVRLSAMEAAFQLAEQIRRIGSVVGVKPGLRVRDFVPDHHHDDDDDDDDEVDD
eukprot:ANDGO_03948.mRNA.1 hypothetical protein